LLLVQVDSTSQCVMYLHLQNRLNNLLQLVFFWYIWCIQSLHSQEHSDIWSSPISVRYPLFLQNNSKNFAHFRLFWNPCKYKWLQNVTAQLGNPLRLSNKINVVFNNWYFANPKGYMNLYINWFLSLRGLSNTREYLSVVSRRLLTDELSV